MRTPSPKASPFHRMDVLTVEWPKVVGAQLARQCVPVAVLNDSLVVRAFTFQWVEEVGRLREQIIRRVNERMQLAEPFRGLTVLSPGSKLVQTGQHGGGRAS